jgi:hypothetical protein
MTMCLTLIFLLIYKDGGGQSAKPEAGHTRAYHAVLTGPECRTELELGTFFMDRCQAIVGYHMMSTHINAKSSIMEMFLSVQCHKLGYLKTSG